MFVKWLITDHDDRSPYRNRAILTAAIDSSAALTRWTTHTACWQDGSGVGGSFVNTTNARTTLFDDGHAINLHLHTYTAGRPARPPAAKSQGDDCTYTSVCRERATDRRRRKSTTLASLHMATNDICLMHHVYAADRCRL